jgi:hypothetical protein
VHAYLRNLEREAERPRYWPGMTPAGISAFLRHIVRELDWLAANEEPLRRALSERRSAEVDSRP